MLVYSFVHARAVHVFGALPLHLWRPAPQSQLLQVVCLLCCKQWLL